MERRAPPPPSAAQGSLQSLPVGAIHFANSQTGNNPQKLEGPSGSGGGVSGPAPSGGEAEGASLSPGKEAALLLRLLFPAETNPDDRGSPKQGLAASGSLSGATGEEGRDGLSERKCRCGRHPRNAALKLRAVDQRRLWKQGRFRDSPSQQLHRERRTDPPLEDELRAEDAKAKAAKRKDASTAGVAVPSGEESSAPARETKLLFGDAPSEAAAAAVDGKVSLSAVPRPEVSSSAFCTGTVQTGVGEEEAASTKREIQEAVEDASAATRPPEPGSFKSEFFAERLFEWRSFFGLDPRLLPSDAFSVCGSVCCLGVPGIFTVAHSESHEITSSFWALRRQPLEVGSWHSGARDKPTSLLALSHFYSFGASSEALLTRRELCVCEAEERAPQRLLTKMVDASRADCRAFFPSSMDASPSPLSSGFAERDVDEDDCKTMARHLPSRLLSQVWGLRTDLAIARLALLREAEEIAESLSRAQRRLGVGRGRLQNFQSPLFAAESLFDADLHPPHNGGRRPHRSFFSWAAIRAPLCCCFSSSGSTLGRRGRGCGSASCSCEFCYAEMQSTAQEEEDEALAEETKGEVEGVSAEAKGDQREAGAETPFQKETEAAESFEPGVFSTPTKDRPAFQEESQAQEVESEKPTNIEKTTDFCAAVEEADSSAAAKEKPPEADELLADELLEQELFSALPADEASLPASLATAAIPSDVNASREGDPFEEELWDTEKKDESAPSKLLESASPSETLQNGVRGSALDKPGGAAKTGEDPSEEGAAAIDEALVEDFALGVDAEAFDATPNGEVGVASVLPETEGPPPSARRSGLASVSKQSAKSDLRSERKSGGPSVSGKTGAAAVSTNSSAPHSTAHPNSADLDQEFEFEDSEGEDASHPHGAAHPAPVNASATLPQKRELHSSVGVSSSAGVGNREGDGRSAATEVSLRRSEAALALGTASESVVESTAAALVQNAVWGEVPGSASYEQAVALVALATSSSLGETHSAQRRSSRGDAGVPREGKRETERDDAVEAEATALGGLFGEEASAQRLLVLTNLEEKWEGVFFKLRSRGRRNSASLVAFGLADEEKTLTPLVAGAIECLHQIQASRFLPLFLDAKPPLRRLLNSMDSAKDPSSSFFASDDAAGSAVEKAFGGSVSCTASTALMAAKTQEGGGDSWEGAAVLFDGERIGAETSTAVGEAGLSRSQQLRWRRRAKQEVLKLEKRRRLELVKQGKTATELRALAAAEELSREGSGATPRSDLVKNVLQFASLCGMDGLLSRLNVSFDEDFKNRRIYQKQTGLLTRETAEGVAAAADGSGAFSGGSSEGGGAHSSYCFLNAADLTLADDAPIALFEYTEQTPLVLNNPGMVVRLLRFLKPASPPPAGSLQQPQQQQHPTASQSGACEGSGEFETITSPAAAPGSSGTASANEEGSRELQQRVAEHEAKLRGLLGPFGALRLVEGGSAPQLFGVDLPLEPGEGQVVLECSLFKAMAFAHPQTPDKALAPASRFHDFRGTDFLLVRRKGADGRMKTFLRPMLYPPEDFASAAGAAFKAAGGVSPSIPGGPESFCLYTVGQQQPKVEVPSPHSRVFLEGRKSQAKAWALRFVRESGINEFRQVRDLVRNGFSPPLLERDVSQMLKQLSPISPHRLPVVPEASVASLISPETVCLLEAAAAASARLHSVGVCTLTSADGLAQAAAALEEEELRHQQNAALAKRQMRLLLQRRHQREEALNLRGSSPQQQSEAQEAQRQALLEFQALLAELSSSRIGRRYSHVVRFIEELLLITPWAATRECKDVLSNRGPAQFVLSGLADPSGGRGEALALLKRGARGRAVSSSTQAGAARRGASGIAGTCDDLRKLSMEQLRQRLLQYGLADAVIRTLPRWDQVALVRQYRDGFGFEENATATAPPSSSGGRGQTNAARGNAAGVAAAALPGGGPRLSSEIYQQRVMGVLKRQMAALSPDDPNITETDEEEPPAQQTPTPPSATGNPQTQPPGKTGEDVAALLFAGLEDSDGEPADDQEMERRELLVFRRRQMEMTGTSEQNQTKAQAEVTPVPCLRWIRRRRQQAPGAFDSGVVIAIYGFENIRKFIQWRNKRLQQKRRRQMEAAHSKEALAGKRGCRACGQPGHIASNVNCPLYKGPKRVASASAVDFEQKRRRLAASAAAQTAGDASNFASYGGAGRRRGARGKESSDDREDEEEEDEELPDSLSSDDAGGSASAQSDAAAERGGGDEAFQEDGAYDDLASEASGLSERKFVHGGGSFRSGKASAAGRASRGRIGGGQASDSRSALKELNLCFAKITNWLIQQQALKPFVSKVGEKAAPGYSSVIAHPMYLRRISSRCRDRHYSSLRLFMNDINLLVGNCFLFNPPHSPSAWLRDRALLLRRSCGEKLVAMHIQIAHLERVVHPQMDPQEQQVCLLELDQWQQGLFADPTNNYAQNSPSPHTHQPLAPQPYALYS